MSVSSCFCFVSKSPFSLFSTLTSPASCRIEPRMAMTTQNTVRPNGAEPPRERRLRRWTSWAPEASDDDEAAPGAVAALMGVPGCCCGSIFAVSVVVFCL